MAIGIVVLDHLRRQCPVVRDNVLSRGGEIKGSRAGLGSILEKYNIPRRYLKEATTRQSHQDGQRLLDELEWGKPLARLCRDVRDSLLQELTEVLSSMARDWLLRQNLKLDIDPSQGPVRWITLILDRAKGRSGGVVEQHLVGAKLERRFSGEGIEIPNYPAHAADVQTERGGDFAVKHIIFHVTATPTPAVIEKCASNLSLGHHPILLIPRVREAAAITLAEVREIDGQVSIISIEDFLALNIIELAVTEGVDFFQVLKEIVA